MVYLRRGVWWPVIKDGQCEVLNPKSNNSLFLEWFKEILANTLRYDNLLLGLTEKYEWIYFTWYENIDKLILDTILETLGYNEINKLEDILKNVEIINSEKNSEKNSEELEKLLYILKKVIIKPFFLEWLHFSKNRKEKLKSILKTSVEKYSLNDLKIIFQFKNITFDILEDLIWFYDKKRDYVINIVDMLNELWIELFPSYLTKDNINNVVVNLLYLKDKKLYLLKLFNNTMLNGCHLKNGKWSMVDLLLLKNKELKILLKSFEKHNINIYLLSITYPWYNFYRIVFDRIENSTNKEKYLNLITNIYDNNWILNIFWIDKYLPENMLNNYIHKKEVTYEQCCYIYDNITQDPNQILKLLDFKYETLLYLFNNVTKNADEIIRDYYSIRDIGSSYIKDIYESIKNEQPEEIHKYFNKFISFFNKNNNIKDSIIKNISFLCKYFLMDITIRLEDEEFIEIMSKKHENIKYLKEEWIFTSLSNFFDYKDIIEYLDYHSLQILNNLHKKKDLNFNDWFNIFLTIVKKPYSKECKNEIIHKIGWLSLPMAQKYMKIFVIIDKSPSYDIKVMKESLVIDILKTDNPEDIVNNINKIFIGSELPIISKIFQVFKYVYSEDNFNKILNNHDKASPFLKSLAKYQKRLDIIYQDLMNIIIKSGESSLKEFIQNIISYKETLQHFELWETLNKEWYKKILDIMKIIVSLNAIISNNSIKNAEILKSDWNIDIKELNVFYITLKKSLLLREKDSLYDFFLNLCKKIWYKSLEDILIDMDKTQLKANNTWLEKYNSMQKWKLFNYSDNYFLKWISSDSLGEILNRWVTSTEYLGWWEWTDDKVSSNGTPLDTDWVMVKWDNILEVAESHWYWDIGIVINTNKQCLYNTDIWLQWYNHRLYEIFKNHGEDCDYYWIRTWIASTEFDAIIYKAETMDLQNLQQIKYYIARNWFYLPVLDLQWNLLFTPQEYHKLRQCFSFSDKYKWYDIENKGWVYVSTKQNDIINEWNEEFKSFVNKHKNLESSNINIDNGTMVNLVFDKIKDILESDLWIKCNIQKNLLWAELYDSWSTWRWTEIRSDDIDLDFTLLVNSEDYDRLDEIKEVIHEKIWTIESADHERAEWNWFQIKSLKNNLWKDVWYQNWINFELLIEKKTRSYLYPSNIAMQDRFSKIEELYGKDTLDFVKQNIVIMKKLLKSQWTYKNIQWWIWWIGVENWIMQHHGNFIEALEAFEDVAYDWKYLEGKDNIPLEKFKNLYPIWDSWHNVISGDNDNFVLKMTDAGYRWVLNIIKSYRTEWLNWLFELINKH